MGEEEENHLPPCRRGIYLGKRWCKPLLCEQQGLTRVALDELVVLHGPQDPGKSPHGLVQLLHLLGVAPFQNYRGAKCHTSAVLLPGENTSVGADVSPSLGTACKSTFCPFWCHNYKLLSKKQQEWQPLKSLRQKGWYLNVVQEWGAWVSPSPSSPLSRAQNALSNSEAITKTGSS